MTPAAALDAILLGDQLRTLQHAGLETDADVRAVADAQRALDADHGQAHAENLLRDQPRVPGLPLAVVLGVIQLPPVGVKE